MHSHSLVFSLGVHEGVRVYLLLPCVSANVLVCFSAVVPCTRTFWCVSQRLCRVRT